MWKPYTVIRDDNVDDRLDHSADGYSQVEYRYSPVCSYWLYGTIVLLLSGVLLENPPLYYLAFVSIAVYFFLVTLPGIDVAKAIKQAAASGDIEIRGSRWSASNPLTFVVRKKTDANESAEA